MIKYTETLKATEVPADAVKFIIEMLKQSGPLKNFHLNVKGSSNQVIQVDNNFEGETGGGKKKWEMKFTISADMPNPTLKQKAHFGCDIYLNKKRVLSTHKWLPDGLLKLGRPDTKDHPLEELRTPLKRKDFAKGNYATWICVSRKYR
jgi:hypothetical protein